MRGPGLCVMPTRRRLAAAALACALLVPALAPAAPADEAAHDRLRTELEQVLAGPGMFRRLFGGGPTPGKRLQLLLDASWRWEMTVRPIYATYVGYPGQNGRWPDLGSEEIQTRRALWELTRQTAEALPTARLTADEQLNLSLFLEQLRTEIAAGQFPEHLLQIDQFNGIHTDIPQALSAMPLRRDQDLADYLARLEGIPRLLEQVTALLRVGLAEGVTPPRVVLAKVPAQIEGLIPRRARDSALISPLYKARGEFGAEQLQAASDAARALYGDVLRPAFSDFLAFVREEYIPGARRSTAFTALPQGEAWYAERVRRYTTTELTPQQIHELGLGEVARIREQMHQLMRGQGFRGSIPDYVARLNADPAQYHASGAAQVEAYRALAKRVDPTLVGLFGRFPSLPYGIDAIPDYEADGRAIAYYLPGSAESGRAGVFYVNTLRVNESPRYEMEALLLHEAVPGHHFQIALTQELEALPAFRRHGGFTAYIEGWGLYAESLGPELGLYTDPDARFGALAFEMWRAVRLVVDTGMHALGWSRARAIDYFIAHTGRPRVRVEAEIDRYLAYVGQALAYKIGQLKMQELRATAKTRLGEAFDIRAFHDHLLGAGALPLNILETRMNEWIAAQEAADAS